MSVVHSAQLNRMSTSSLEVTWELTGDGPVTVAVGARPDAVVPVASVNGERRYLLTDLAPGRHYIALTPVDGPPVVVAERVLGLAGATNFRDLGGYPTVDGGRTRWGRVFRSDATHRLTEADLAVIDGLGLRVVFDLRMDAERDRSPSALPESVRRELFTIGGDSGRVARVSDVLADGGMAAAPDDFLVRIYTAMAETDAATFGRLLTALAQPANHPALFHCTAGKDRTGMTAALLLFALDVTEDAVLDDYELSAVHFIDRQLTRLKPRLAALGMDAARYRRVFGAPREAMATTLATLRTTHGSIRGYLTTRAGLTDETFAQLRENLVEPAS